MSLVFQVTIPAGVQIIGWDGQPNTQVSVKAIPIDRSPLPPPPPGQSSRVVYLFYFGKVGGGLPTGNIPVDTPNDVGGLPGDKVDLYYFNEAPDGTAPNQWEKYGTGTVSPDSTRIITDINPAIGQPYGIPRFCCGGRRNDRQPSPSPGGGPSGGSTDSGEEDGEPVDTATGFFYLTKTDLVIPGIIPLTISRTYRTNLTNAGPFGLGTSWEYERFLQPPPNGSPDALLLFSPGNRQDLFARQPDGSFANSTSPALRGAVVTVVSGTRTLRFKDGRSWRFRTSDGLLVSQADRNGNTVLISLDSQGRVTALTEPAGRQLTFSYTGASLRIDRITDPLGRTVSYTYDAQSRLETVIDPAAGITRYTYDANHRMLTITDPRNITFLTNEFDAQGRIIRQTQADGGVWTFSYATTGSFISQTVVTDPRGNATTYRFNSAGYLIQRTDALGQTTTSERQPGTNLLLNTTDPLGRVTRFSYDGNGNVTSITDPAGNTRTFTYDPTFSKVASVTDAMGGVSTYVYDGRGNLINTSDALGNATHFSHNQFGLPVSVTDAMGNVTEFTYTAHGDLENVIDPLGNISMREYDLVSRLVRQIDPRGKITAFAYDPLNRPLSILDALGGITTFTYDPGGNLLAIPDARGNTITYEYDSLNRPSRRVDPLGRAEIFAYDGKDNLVSFTDRKGQVSTFTYDALDRPVRMEFADGSVMSRTYDAVSRVVNAEDTADPHRPIARQYDVVDRLLTETTALGSVSHQYDSLGRRMRTTVGGQVPIVYTFDANSRLRIITQVPLVSVNIEYDALNRRTRLTFPNSVSTEYSYDPASRLTGLIYRLAESILGDLTYQYDAAGNRMSAAGSLARALLPDPVFSATYDAANEQVVFGNRTMNFDENGNLVSVTEGSRTITYTWDARDRLVAFIAPEISGTFAYDAAQRRAMKVVGGQTTTIQYDAFNTIREVLGGAEVTYLHGPNLDEPLIRNSSDYYLADALGSVIALVDSTGSLTTRYTYDPFGRTATDGFTSMNPFQYTARETDASGLYYYRARYYDPQIGRFIQRDPAGLGGGLNLYAYVGGNPTNFRDPFGLFRIYASELGSRTAPTYGAVMRDGHENMTFLSRWDDIPRHHAPAILRRRAWLCAPLHLPSRRPAEDLPIRDIPPGHHAPRGSRRPPTPRAISLSSQPRTSAC